MARRIKKSGQRPVYTIGSAMSVVLERRERILFVICWYSLVVFR